MKELLEEIDIESDMHNGEEESKVGGSNAVIIAVNGGQNPDGYINLNAYDIIEGTELTLTEKPMGKGHIKVKRSGAYSITVGKKGASDIFENRTLELYENYYTYTSTEYKFDRCYKEKEYYLEITNLESDTLRPGSFATSINYIDTDGERVDKLLLQWKVVLYLLAGDYYIKWDTGYDFPQTVLFAPNTDMYELRYDLLRYPVINNVVPENSCYGVFWDIKDEFLKSKVYEKQYKYLPLEPDGVYDITQFQVKCIFYMDKILAGVFYYTVTEYIAMDKYMKKSWMDKAWSVFFKIVDKDNELTKDARKSLQSLIETGLTTVLGNIVSTSTGVFFTIVLYVLNQDPEQLLPEIAQVIRDAGGTSSSAIKQTQLPVILKIGELTKMMIDDHSSTTQASARCAEWNMRKTTAAITAYGEPYYDGEFFCSENNVQDIINLLKSILQESTD